MVLSGHWEQAYGYLPAGYDALVRIRRVTSGAGREKVLTVCAHQDSNLEPAD